MDALIELNNKGFGQSFGFGGLHPVLKHLLPSFWLQDGYIVPLFQSPDVR
jgi:hypothetical protein